MPRADLERPRAADAIEDLARRVDRLSVSRMNPHAFFEERSEIVHDMRRIAGEIRTQSGSDSAA